MTNTAAPNGWGALRDERAKHWDWGPLYGCFPTANGHCISPSDLDFVVERFGRFLVFETKAPTERVSLGQEIMLRALARDPRFSVYLVTGLKNTPTRIERITPSGADTVVPTGWDGLRRLAAKWFAWANTRSRRSA